jgi:geranylgeranyl diphosphate synthase type II
VALGARLVTRAANIERTLEAIRRDVDAALDALLPAESAPPRAVHEALRYAVFAGGKRVRPALLVLAGEAVGGARADLLDAAAGVELIHAASLVLDDLPSQDNAPTRRGRPATHVRFGEATAVLASTALVTLGIRVVAESARRRRVGEATLGRVVRLVADAIGTDGMIGGQIVDLESGPGHDTMETLEYIHSHKTGALFIACAEVGALLAGAGEAEVRALAEHAKNVGLGYQITDDILDLEAHPTTLGKPTGQDRGKATFATLFGIEVSRRVAGELFEAAEAALRPFGPRGRDLLAFTRWVARRIA